jgi:hypothetical protein
VITHVAVETPLRPTIVPNSVWIIEANGLWRYERRWTCGSRVCGQRKTRGRTVSKTGMRLASVRLASEGEVAPCATLTLAARRKPLLIRRPSSSSHIDVVEMQALDAFAPILQIAA